MVLPYTDPKEAPGILSTTEVPGHKNESDSNETDGSSEESPSETSALIDVSLSLKIVSIIMVSAIGFGSSWSSGITGAMKTALKKGLKINNTQYALLDASEDFMKTALVILSGVVTDRIGGAKAILYGNVLYSIGSILVAAATTVRSYKFMIFGQIVLSFGDIATQIASYKIFSSWFPPSHGFASTLALELAIGKIGAFVGKSTANIIAKKMGDFSWVYWISVFMNLFTNVMTVVFYWFTKYCERKFKGMSDPATGEILTESNDKFQWRKILELPWVFWGVLLFSLFETSNAIVFQANATELAQIRFGTDAITAGWYTSLLQYSGFFIVPCIGIFIDLYGNRLTLFVVCGAGVLLSMCLVNWAGTTQGTAAAFGLYAVAYSLGPTLIIDSIRTSIWHQSVFGSAYAVKITMNNAQNIIVRILTGVLQDGSPALNPYKKVTPVYVILSAGSFVVSVVFMSIFLYAKWAKKDFFVDIARLQWTRKQRIAHGKEINDRSTKVALGEDKRADIVQTKERMRMAKISTSAFGVLCLWVLGSWVAYFWGVATGNSD